ncbi:Asp23/Gls24 family envelope stress response protein [Candidatus Bipolaricaulota bacterium]|nr:Asp23/Gls24 family envelope stress response protein [Candidatus Bipolaricaulota bacterium]
MAENDELVGSEEIDGGVVNDKGTITISEKVVIAVVAGGASQIEGLGQKKSSVTEDIGRIFGSKRRGVSIDFDGNEVSITLKIAVKQGYPVHEIAKKTQKKIKEDVESKTGLRVNSVDIYVQKLQEVEGKGEELIPEDQSEED